MSHEFLDRLDNDPDFRRRVLDEVKGGLDDLETGNFIELDDEGLKAFFEEIKREGREKLRRWQSQSRGNQDPHASEG